MEVFRIGTVTAIDDEQRQVRVHFPEVDIVSGWLKVLKSPPFIPARDAKQQTEKASGGEGEEAFEEHSHLIRIAPWMPSLGDSVLCIYNPGFNDDGYVLGAI